MIGGATIYIYTYAVYVLILGVAWEACLSYWDHFAKFGNRALLCVIFDCVVRYISPHNSLLT